MLGLFGAWVAWSITIVEIWHFQIVFKFSMEMDPILSLSASIWMFIWFWGVYCHTDIPLLCLW